MGRRSSGAVRANRDGVGRSDAAPRSIPGFSQRAMAAITEMESRHLWSNATADALASYKRFLARPGRWLHLPLDDGPSDPCEARDTLDRAMRALPPQVREVLARVVADLDMQFERRTLPDPFAGELSQWQAQAWWRQRIRER